MERCDTCPAKEGDSNLCRSIILEGFCELFSEDRPVVRLNPNTQESNIVVPFTPKETLRNGKKVKIHTLEPNSEYL